jgi:hypothetical protein
MIPVLYFIILCFVRLLVYGSGANYKKRNREKEGKEKGKKEKGKRKRKGKKEGKRRDYLSTVFNRARDNIRRFNRM